MNKEQGQKEYDLEMLMRIYGNNVLCIAFWFVRDKNLAEDIFQEVFIKVNRRKSDFVGDDIKALITRTTINTCIDYCT